MKLLFYAVAATLAGASGANDEAVLVTVVADTRNLVTNDPLFVKVILENQGENGVRVELPARQNLTLRLFVEYKPNAGHYYAAQESGDVIPERWFHQEGSALKPGEHLVAYDRLVRTADGDFVFRKEGEYKVYATVSLPTGSVAKSEVVAIHVTQAPRQHEELIERNYKLLRRVTVIDSVSLQKPGDLAQLELILKELRAQTSFRSRWQDTLEWRIPIYQLKYGDAEQQSAAEDFLNKLTAPKSFPSLRRELIALFRSQVAVESGEATKAKFHLRGVADSLVRRSLEARIRKLEAKLPPGNLD